MKDEEYKKISCLLKQGLLKDRPVGVTVRMTFNPQMDKKLALEEFKITTKVELDGSKKMSHSTFEKTKNDVGSWKKIQKLWPVFLGIIIGTIIFSAAMYGLYKNDMFSKVRIYDNIEDTAPPEGQNEMVTNPT